MSGPLLPTWEQLAVRPAIVDTMRRYLAQIGCVLRPGSVTGADQALRAFAAFLAETSPEVTSIGQVTRRHIEDYKPWLAKRPGQNKARASTATLAHRRGTLRMFFVRIDEWAGTRHRTGCRCSPATCHAETTQCPKPSTTQPPRSCCVLPTPSPGC